MSAFKDRSGKQYGRLLALKFDGKQGRASMWLCRCECGKEKAINGDNLQSGATRSCGCYNVEVVKERSTTHGATVSLKKRSLYIKWCSMLARCYNKNNPKYNDYGGRGIIVCDEWRKDYAAFESYMLTLPNCPNNVLVQNKKLELTLDRYPDNDGNYEPGNVRWATYKQQNNNRRSNTIIKVTVNRQSFRITLADAINRYAKAPYRTVWARLNAGWDLKQALLTPAKG